MPSIVLYGADDGIVRPAPEASDAERAVFPQPVAPREAPGEMSSALLRLLTRTRDL